MKRLAIVLTLIAAMSAMGTWPGHAHQADRYVDVVFSHVSVTPDIAYGAAVNDTNQLQTLSLDLYQPVGDPLRARPVIVWAHGGSGVGGDKANAIDREISAMFARRGWVVASINYRLMSRATPGDAPVDHDFLDAIGPRLYDNLREAQHDMQAAVRWFRANAASLRIDPGSIAAAGHSYGGGMAGYVNFAPDDPGESGNPGFPSDVRATFIHSSSLLEPSEIGPGEPPIVMIHALDDADQTYYLGNVMTCTPTRAVGNECEQHVFQTGGHQMAKHRPLVVDIAATFLCQRAVAGGCAG
jgi:dienelactone hydrolase